MSEFVFKLPDLGEGTVEAEIAEWMVRVGDTVLEEDPVCAMLTDKAAVELTAPVSGRIVSVAGEEGDTVAVGSPLIVFETEASTAVAGQEAPAAEPAMPKPAARPAAPSTRGKVATSPSIRARARETGVDLGKVPGSGPRGRILKADFEAFLSASGTSTLALEKRSGTTEIKVIGLRRKIAERMAKSASEIPHFTYVEEIDVTALESLRRHLNSKKAAGGTKLTPLAFLGLALVRVLQDFPQCNAHYDGDRNVIIRHEAVHLGIATQTGDGLKVPVVRHAESLTLDTLAGEIRRIAEAARDNSAGREELSGSTITLTSLGKMGGVVSTPVINQPEVAIIGVNRAVERPVVIGGRIEVRTMMNLSSSFDHRFVDGYDAAAMIQGLKELLEQPATLFI
ncbi:MAG: dihydrolipoamide acetyltransferase family protein [Xanthomonadales bacterium]|jgi:2-oxoisovalerate dehydrogenase E2 component (dihydrolipoyl transacylase)|nr:dihydrolipoamide acetyltransferase family protein [Xanthomonadales bacterium]